MAGQLRRLPVAADDLTVVEWVAAYLNHAAAYYGDADGRVTSERSARELPTRVLTRLYGRTPTAAFGPPAMAAVRDETIAAGWGRAGINAHAGRVRRLFKWAVSRELLPANVHQALTSTRR